MKKKSYYKPYKTIYKEPPNKESKKKLMRIIAFWFFFAIFIIILFSVNMPKIKTTLQNVFWPVWLKSNSSEREPILPRNPLPEPIILPEENMNQTELTLEENENRTITQERTQAESLRQIPQTTNTPPSQPVSIIQPNPNDLRERGLYFIQVDRNGVISRVRSPRNIPATNSPLNDSLELLLMGPNDDEKQRGLISLIPQETKILSINIVRDTAYINISEDFQYNAYGVEGYAAQLIQIIWTVTEFSNIKDVQILIEGRKIDYLGEGIWIGSPLNRDNF